RIFTIVGNRCPLTRITSEIVPPKKSTIALVITSDLKVVQIVLWYLDSGCSKHMTRNRSQLMNFVSKFLGTVRFWNDQIAKIMGYGDYQLGNVIISRVYYIEGLGHNLFSVGQFCDVDLEVAFPKNTCFIRNLEGVDLLSRSRDTNLYTISLDDMLKAYLKRQSLRAGYGTFACALGKSNKSSHQPKAEDTNQEKLYLLHMDLCGPKRVESINGKKYILVIVDDYSRFTWVRFLRSKDEAPEAIIKCIKNIQVRLNAIVRNVRTDNGTEFVNQTLREFYENVSISHETSVARTPQQNGLMQDKKPDLSFLHVFGSLCYPTHDSEDLGKLYAKADIGLGLQSMTPATSSSGLVSNPIPQQPCITPKRDDWDFLFLPMFDEYFNPPTIDDSPVPVATAPRAVDLADSLVSTSIDQDAPSTDTPMVENNNLDEDLQGKQVNATLYHGMIGSLMYLTSTYADADHAGCQDTRRSTSGSAQFLGDKLVSWSSKKQKSTGISNYGLQFNKIPLYCDNNSTIGLCCNNVQHSRAKHIDIQLLDRKARYEKHVSGNVETSGRGRGQVMVVSRVAARNEKWVPSTERVKISFTNIRLETTVPQKEETFQVIIDVIKNSTCFKAFTISANVPEIFMHPFWYTIKKVQDTDSYEFLLANKKCIVNAEVFRTILNICPRVEGEDVTDVPDDETALTFLLDLGYKGPLNRHTSMENVDYPELIWEDLSYQIDHRKEKRSRRKNMPYPRFTKIIINHFLKQHKSLTNLNHKHYHTIKDDGIVNYLEYGHPILDIPPKKSRGKGSKGRKAFDDSQETVDISEESEPEPEPAKKKTASRRVVKKKITLSADDNIISDDPDAALELAKSISQTEAEEAEAARKVHATHVRIVTESIPESGKKKSGGRSLAKLKGTPSLTPAEQEAANIMQALKESKKTSRRQPGIGGSHEGTGSKPGVLDESTVISATTSEGTGAKPGVPMRIKT
ncbi:retrovirus-related pol polyprotein from transposon TNT 1-94, partial [Tanacetum coccineum]